jgi:hypothetical protein
MEKKAMMLHHQQLQLQQQLSGRALVAQEAECCASAPSPSSPAPRAIPASASLVQLLHIVMPPHANHMNTMFGGILMEWAEEAARLSVHRHLHAMSHGQAPQNLKVLVRKFEHMGQPSTAPAASKRWFHLSTVWVNSQVSTLFFVTSGSYAVTWTASRFLLQLRLATECK